MRGGKSLERPAITARAKLFRAGTSFAIRVWNTPPPKWALKDGAHATILEWTVQKQNTPEAFASGVGFCGCEDAR
jgi:hypothetical protein